MFKGKRWIPGSLACFFVVVSATTSQNVTIDDLSPDVHLTPIQDWAWSDEGPGAVGSTFSFSSSEDATVTFTFPVPATGVDWQGFKRSDAALYSVCIDCSGDPNDPAFVLVDGHDANAQPTDPAEIIFSARGLLDAVHNITIRNHFDIRFNSVSQITVDAFILATSQVPVSVSRVSAMPAGPSDTALQANGPTASSTPLGSNGSTSNLPAPTSDPQSLVGTVSKGFVAGIVTGAFAFVLGIMGLLWWSLRRARRKYAGLNGDESPEFRNQMMESPMTATLSLAPQGYDRNLMATIMPHSSSENDRTFVGPEPITNRTTSPTTRGPVVKFNDAVARRTSYATQTSPTRPLPARPGPFDNWVSHSRSRASYARLSRHSLYSAPSVYSTLDSSENPSSQSIYSTPSAPPPVPELVVSMHVASRSPSNISERDDQIPIGISNPFVSPADNDLSPVTDRHYSEFQSPIEPELTWLNTGARAGATSLEVPASGSRMASLDVSQVVEDMRSVQEREESNSKKNGSPPGKDNGSYYARGHGRKRSSPTFI